MTTADKLYLRIREAAEILDVSERTIRRRLRDGSLPHVKLGRLIRIPAGAVVPNVDAAE